MRKLFLIIIPFIMILLLSACKGNKELYCEYEIDGGKESVKIVYNDDEIVAFYDNEEKLSQKEVDEGVNSALEQYDSIPDFIDAYEDLIIQFGNGTCTRK